MVTTTPDDVFYILKIVLSRLLSTGSVNTVERTLDLLRDVMDRDYSGVIKKKLDDVYRTAGPSGPNSRGEKAERENRVAFIVGRILSDTSTRLYLLQILLNDLDISSSHLERLTRDLSGSPAIAQHFIGAQQTLVKTHMLSFSGLASKFRSTLRVRRLLSLPLSLPKLRNTDWYRTVVQSATTPEVAQSPF